MKRSRGRPPNIDGCRITQLRGEEFWTALGEAGFEMYFKLTYVTGSKLVYQRHALLERDAVAWITGRTAKAVTHWEDRDLLVPIKHIGTTPLFDIGDVAHLVATGEFPLNGELCPEAMAAKYEWTVPGFDKRPNEPGSPADELAKAYAKLNSEYHERRHQAAAKPKKRA